MSQTRMLADVEELVLRLGQANFIVRTGMEEGPGDQVSRFAAIYKPGELIPRGTWRLIASGRLLAQAEDQGLTLTREELARLSLPLAIAWLEADLDRAAVDIGDERRWLGLAALGLSEPAPPGHGARPPGS